MKKVNKKVTFDVEVFVAEDGREFETKRDCESYESTLKKESQKRKLREIKTCEELNDYSPLDGGEYYENHCYKWYFVETKEQLDLILSFYNIKPLVPLSLNQWVCIDYEYSENYYDYYAWCTPISSSLDRIQFQLEKLGYDVKISRKDSEK